MISNQFWWAGALVSLVACILLIADLFDETGSLKAVIVIPWAAAAAVCFMSATGNNKGSPL